MHPLKNFDTVGRTFTEKRGQGTRDFFALFLHAEGSEGKTNGINHRPLSSVGWVSYEAQLLVEVVFRKQSFHGCS